MSETVQLPPIASLTDADTLRAASLVRTGKVYDLDCGRWPGMPLFPGHPPLQVLVHRSAQGVRVQGDQTWLEPNDVNYGWTTEVVMSTVHTGTHIDALSHITCGFDDHWFGGKPSSRYLGNFGPVVDDASELPPITARGVLLDVPAVRGVGALPAHDEITRADLEAALARQGTELRRGDVVLVRSGYLSAYPDAAGIEAHKQAGIGLEAALFLAQAGAVAVGGDTESLECLPSRVPGNPHPVHIALLVERGIHILEMVDCEELARDGVYEFFFVCAPLKIKGATGSMVRPLAIV